MTASAGIDAALSRAARDWPDRIAFSCRGDTLSYAALLARARSVAGCLVDEGVRPGDRVGIAMTKGLEMPAAIYGIWLAGAAFVPLDPLAPVARHLGILEDCGIRVLIGAERNRALLADLAGRSGATVVGAEIEGVRCRQPVQDRPDLRPAANAPDDLAYIIFTSGSTGTPKGITHTHRSGKAFAEAWRRHYGLTRDDVFFCTVPLHFDFSLADFFTPPLAGARTELVAEQMLMFPASLAGALEDSGATIWSTVPSPILQIVERGGAAGRDLSKLRWIIYGGEPMPPAKLEGIRSVFDAEISNSYGPAEVNQVTQYTVPRSHPADSAIPIGHVMEHADLVLSDDGEMLFAGEMTMRGYWNRPALNEAAFVDRDGKRYYRTGDLGALGPDGLWRFHGRVDRQVKIRGHRVELDEVEATLAAHPAVSEAGVVPNADRTGLAAFVTAKPGHEAGGDELRAHCAALLPSYAVPATIVIRDTLARTSTGKIDRRALAEEAS